MDSWVSGPSPAFAQAPKIFLCAKLTHDDSGAFAFGSNSVARYRPHAFAGQAKSLGKPVILVQINYRLGALGFAASKHITLDTGDPRIGNYGFVDQRNALLWVNAHVQNFGGDPSNITVFGVSAGSASIHHHLLSGAPLFDRAIMMSGVAPTLGPYPLHALEKSWEKPCDRYGLTQSTSAERLRFLRGLDPLELLEAYSTGVVGPAADGKLLPSNCGIADPIPSSRCKAIILGDTNAESMIYKPLIQHLSQSHFHQRVHAEFSQYDAQEFYTHFGFTTRPEPEETFEGKILSLLGTVIFHFPNMQIAAHGNLSNPDMDMFLYHFEEPSPFPGPTHGYSYHGLCALLLHLNSFKECPKPTQDVSLELHRIWTFFAYGEQPWESYSNSHRFMRFGPDGGLNMLNQNKDTTRTYGYLPWLAQHFDQIYPFLRSILTELRENSLPLR